MVVGIVLSSLALAMIVPAVVDVAANNPDWQVFAASAGVALFTGVALILTNRAPAGELSVRQTFLLTTITWVVAAAFGALPFAFSDLNLSYSDAFFEAMSGITTTGSTVLAGLDSAPPGILLWRALLQWLGGIGIILIAVAFLPRLQVGGMQLFHTESSDPSGKVLPRVAQLATALGTIYVLITVICALGLWAAGMSPFEAVAHAMTTIATGGFSTSDSSIGHFDSAVIDWIITAFMILGSLPFVLYLEVMRRDSGPLLRDSQVRFFLATLLVLIALMTMWLVSSGGMGAGAAIRYASFNVVSIVTGTGYSTADYGQWGSFAVVSFLFFMFIGGCAGSTSCGIKIFRYQVLLATAGAQIKRLWQPHGVFVPHYNRKPIPESVSDAVTSFFFLFVFTFALIALGLTALGLDFVTAVSGAATAITNVGPALGEIIGPAGNFQALPDAAKWLLSAGMLLGRLELLTVLVLFTPRFWQG